MPKKLYQLTRSKDLPCAAGLTDAMRLVQEGRLDLLEQKYYFFIGFWVPDETYNDEQLSLLNELNQLNSEGMSVLMLAVQLGEVEIVEFLLNKEVDTGYCNQSGHTALTLAYSLNQADTDKEEYSHIIAVLINYMRQDGRKKLALEQVKVALKLDQERFEQLISDLIGDGMKFLNIAVGQNDVEMMQYLERRYFGEDVHLGTMYGCLKQAAEQGSLAIVKDLVTRHPTLLQMESSNPNIGCSALHVAAYYDKHEVVGYLAKLPASLVEVTLNSTDLNGRTALHVAAASGHLIVVHYLVMLCPGLSRVRDKNGRSALDDAACKGHLEVVKYLAKNCPSLITPEANTNHTVLSLAAEGGHSKVVMYLVEEFPRLIRMRNGLGSTVLHAAARFGRLKIVSYLAQKYIALVNIPTNDGETALHAAARLGHLGVVSYLASGYVGLVDIQANDGKTVLHTATHGHQLSIVEYLIKRFPNLLQIKDSNENMALHLAVFQGWEEGAKVLAQACPSLVHQENRDHITPISYAQDNGFMGLTRFFVELSRASTPAIPQQKKVETKDSAEKEEGASCSHCSSPSNRR